jgi:predicted HNH restriction endonuclease
MKLINTKRQLLSNIRTVEHYLADGKDEEQLAVRELIRRGKCFVAYEVKNEVRFAPSRFLGYINNNIKKHNAAKARHDVNGWDTNPVISQVLKQQLFSPSKLETKYRNYCSDLGITPANFKRRKYWRFELQKDFEENELLEGEFPEGRVVERMHKSRERNTMVVEIAKGNFKRKHGKLFCQVCKFDFEEVYGEIGKNFIEGHHIIPVAKMKEGHVTKPDEIAILCSNCHRMVHKKRPWLTMEKLNSLLKHKR